MNDTIAKLLTEYRRLKADADAIDVTPIPFPEICSEYLTRGRPITGEKAEELGRDSIFVRLGHASASDWWTDWTIDQVYPHVRAAHVQYRESVEMQSSLAERHAEIVERLAALAVRIADELITASASPPVGER